MEVAGRVSSTHPENRPDGAMTTRFRRVLLPSEHGGWGLVAEPVALGLLVAFSPTAILLAGMALAAFLLRQPLRLALSDRRRGKVYARTRVATGAAGLLAATVLVLVAGAWQLAPQPFWAPLAAALPLVAVQVGFDARLDSRALPAELAGALALGCVPAAMALADGWQPAQAWALWGLVAARALPSILYVRALIRRLHREPLAPGSALAAHGVALALLVAGVRLELAPGAAIVGGALLVVRALAGLWRPAGSARTIGWGEILVGTIYILLLVVGYRIA